MKVAVVGSRSIVHVPLEAFVPADVEVIISGGAAGVDTCARLFAKEYGYTMMEFFPNYKKHGKKAPLIRNDKIVAEADLVLIFWDGESRGSQYVINKCKELNVPHKVYLYTPPSNDKN